VIILIDDLHYKDHLDFFAGRIAKLRVSRGLSAREMSLSIGQDGGYIGKVERKLFLPSMSVFFSICDFFNIPPREFFDDENKHPEMLNELINRAKLLDGDQLKTVSDLIWGLVKK
jgi:transcriptional regulator with XRE-family HTH domain